MVTNTELLESFKNILETSYNYPNRDTDCLSYVISNETKVEGSCKNVGCIECIFFAPNYEQTIELITNTENIIKLKELIE